jgi:uncharacterized protein (DUF2147 family)
MTRAICLAAATALIVAATIPATADSLGGTWLVQDRTAKVRMVSCGDAVCGAVVWLSQPNDAATGKPQTDKLNSDLSKRSRPMLGVPVVLNMKRNNEDSKWWGKLYNPDDGNTYRGSIEVLDPTRLRVRACVAIYCQSEIWTRAD